MMRAFLLSLLFFFGPVLFIFVLRHLGMLLRLWLLARRARRPDIIDVTPPRMQPPSTAFIVIAVIAGLVFAVLAWQRLISEGEVEKHYVPAQVDEQGRVVPGYFK